VFIKKKWKLISHFFEVHETSILVSIGVIVGAGILLAGILYAVAPKTESELTERSALFDFFGGQTVEEESLPSVLPRRIDGVIVAREDANRVPACVMIENAAFDGVRPQSGLSRASVVYEVVVEGGITRFMAVFAGEESEMVGPVRSARDTYLEFVSEYNCAYMHAGGSYTALRAIPRFELRDVDGLREAKYFWRQSGKYSPHNLFTSTTDLYQSIVDHGWADEDPLEYQEWNFVDPLEQTGESVGTHRVSIFFGGAYNVDYNYNEEQKYYERSNGNVLQHDAVNDEVISARNVILQHVGEGQYIEGKGRVNWPVTGTGTVEIFHDGKKFEGLWRKNSREERTEFIDPDGNLIPLARGNSWISIVPDHITIEEK